MNALYCTSEYMKVHIFEHWVGASHRDNLIAPFPLWTEMSKKNYYETMKLRRMIVMSFLGPVHTNPFSKEN